MKKMKLMMSVMLTGAALALGAMSSQAANIAVVGGSNDDAFWNKIKKGIDDARPGIEANGGTVNYLRLVNYDNFAPDVVGLIRTAISQKVDGLVIPNWVPDAEDPAIKDAMAAGIKVILMNAGGAAKAKELGAINYVGNEEYPAGLAGGEYFGKSGKKNVLCVNHIPGAQNLEDRCKGIMDGIAKTGGKSTQLPLPSTASADPVAQAEAVKASLLKDPTIDGVVTLGADMADAAAIGISQAGKTDSVALAAFDMNATNLDRIKNGTQLFVIDQQPYLQGYLATSLLASAIDFGTDLPTFPVLTGPGIVDKTNIEATLVGVAKGAR
jgi:simple sugar transport system substrate-binding protein